MSNQIQKNILKQTKETCLFTHKDKQDCGWMHVYNRMDMYGPKYFWSTAPLKKKKKKLHPLSTYSVLYTIQKHSYCAGKDMHAEKEEILLALGKNQR